MASKRDKKRDIPPANLNINQNWLSQLVEEINVRFPPDGEGWATINQICEAA